MASFLLGRRLGYRPSIRLMRGASAALTVVSPFRRRIRFGAFFSRMWLLLIWRRRSLPVPVTLKRFAAPRWVFILGIRIPLLLRVAPRVPRRERGPPPEPVPRPCRCRPVRRLAPLSPPPVGLQPAPACRG